MNKTITITVDVDGNSVSREFKVMFPEVKDWQAVIESMLDTLEKTNEEKF